MSNFPVALVNASTVINDADGAAAAAALQIQVSRDFAPVWGVDATITYIPKGATAPASSWHLAILDNSDQAGALGYHDLTSSGQPLGKIFAKTDLTYKLQWSVTASHELLEMLADPWINLTVFDQNTSTAGRLYAYEVCDACEDDSFAYTINSVMVSDFVFPAWFEGWRAQSSTKFDFQNKITKPFALLRGGYISYFDIARGGGWRQEFGESIPNVKSRAPIGSRRERRTVGQYQWVPSTV